MADCYSRLRNWDAMRTLLSKQNWGDLNPQRDALLSTAYRQEAQNDLARAKWQTALASAQSQPGALASLARLAFSENRLDDALDALWRIPFGDPDYGRAQKDLFIYYGQKKDAANLLRLLKGTLAQKPNDPSVKLSVATLLLVRDSEPDLAARLAREVYQADPKPVRHAAVYAYSIYQQNPTGETAARAAAILDALSPQDKANDDCLVYYGLILAGGKRYDEARACFNKMDRSKLFPEMAQKVEDAESKMP
jgi:tetratricopeptide (TPR) repeat protein